MDLRDLSDVSCWECNAGLPSTIIEAAIALMCATKPIARVDTIFLVALPIVELEQASITVIGPTPGQAFTRFAPLSARHRSLDVSEAEDTEKLISIIRRNFHRGKELRPLSFRIGTSELMQILHALILSGDIPISDLGASLQEKYDRIYKEDKSFKFKPKLPEVGGDAKG